MALGKKIGIGVGIVIIIIFIAGISLSSRDLQEPMQSNENIPEDLTSTQKVKGLTTEQTQLIQKWEKECEEKIAKAYLTSENQGDTIKKSCSKKIQNKIGSFERVNAGDYSVRSDLLPTPEELGLIDPSRLIEEKHNGAIVEYMGEGLYFRMELTEVVPEKFAKTFFDERKTKAEQNIPPGGNPNNTFVHFNEDCYGQVNDFQQSYIIHCRYDEFLVDLIASKAPHNEQDLVGFTEITKNKIELMKSQ